LCENLIINTLIKATNSGKAKNTVTSISHSLKQLSQHADLANPEEVETYIANASICNATKTKLAFGYQWFCKKTTSNGKNQDTRQNEKSH